MVKKITFTLDLDNSHHVAALQAIRQRDKAYAHTIGDYIASCILLALNTSDGDGETVPKGKDDYRKFILDILQEHDNRKYL